jgi:hypothetical protein
MMIVEDALSLTRLEQLRKRINDKDYVHAAIHRIAFVLSNELMEMFPEGGNYNEWQRKKRR